MACGGGALEKVVAEADDNFEVESIRSGKH
jgi:hypothetical protein